MCKLIKYRIRQTFTVFFVFVLIISFVFPSMGYKKLQENNLDSEFIKIDGSIIARYFEQHFGVVSPIINISNNLTLELNVKQKNNTYHVDSIIRIDVDIIGNISNKHLIGRYLLSLIYIDIKKDQDELKNEGLLDLLFSNNVFKTFSKINILSNNSKFIDIPLKYETNDVSNNASMHIFAFGLPFSILKKNASGFIYEIKNLELRYNISKCFDVNPPVTQCHLNGEFLR